MRSKRASAIGSFISNYYSLIFLAIILGVFIFTSPFIKLAVKPSESSTETINLGGYSVLFNLLNKNIVESEELIFLPSQKIYPIVYSGTEGLYYFMFDENNHLSFHIGMEELSFDEIDLDYKSPATYYLNELEISNENYFIISELKQKKNADYEKQLDILRDIKEVSYAK